MQTSFVPVARPGVRPTIYVVQPGDTPTIITQQHGKPPELFFQLIAANPQKPRVLVGSITTFETLQVGEKLFLPPGWNATSYSIPPTYTVQRGDTVLGILEKLGVPLYRSIELVQANPQKRTVEWNGMLTFHSLLVGEKLKLPATWTWGSSGFQGLSGVGDIPGPLDYWDFLKTCGNGYHRNWSTGFCDPDQGTPDTSCPPGFRISPTTGTCIPNLDIGQDPICPSGQYYSDEFRECIDRPFHTPGALPKDVIGRGDCPQGYIDDPVNPAHFCIADPWTFCNPYTDPECCGADPCPYDTLEPIVVQSATASPPASPPIPQAKTSSSTMWIVGGLAAAVAAGVATYALSGPKRR